MAWQLGLTIFFDNFWFDKMWNIHSRRVCFYSDCIESNNLGRMLISRHAWVKLVSQYIWRTWTEFRRSYVDDKRNLIEIFLTVLLEVGYLFAQALSLQRALICVWIEKSKSIILLTKQNLTTFRFPSMQYFHFFM